MKITVKATVNAPLDKVWSYYTDPSHITGWNFASPDWQCPWAKNDLQIGGTYCARMEAKDGSFGFDFEGVYNRIAEKEALGYLLGDGRQVDVTLQDLGEQTHVEVTFDAESEHPAEFQHAGWQAILDNFKKYTEQA